MYNLVPSEYMSACKIEVSVFLNTLNEKLTVDRSNKLQRGIKSFTGSLQKVNENFLNNFKIKGLRHVSLRIPTEIT